MHNTQFVELDGPIDDDERRVSRERERALMRCISPEQNEAEKGTQYSTAVDPSAASNRRV